MKSFLLLALAVATGSTLTAQDSIWISPAQAHPGDQITIYFHSTRSVFAHAKSVSGGFYSLDDRSHMVARDLVYKKSGDNWMAAAGIPDTAYAIAVNVARPDTSAFAAAAAVGLDSSNGELFPKSCLALAGAYYQYSNLLGITTDKDKSAAYRQQYWNALSAPPPGFNGKISYFLITKKDTTKTLNLLANLPLDSTATENDYSVASNYARQLKNNPLSTLLVNVRNQKYPRGDWKRFEYYNRIATANDSTEQWKMLDEYTKAYPDDGQSTHGQALVPTFKTIILNKLAASGDISGALALIPENISSLDRANDYNTIAWGSCEKDVNIPQALALSKAALDTLQDLETSGRGKPVYQTKAQYVKVVENYYALDADTYAFLLYKTGSYKEAFVFEKKSMDNAGPKPEVDIIERYHLMMEKVETPSKVVASLSGYIAKGESDSAMDAQFKRLYTGDKSADDAYAALTAKAKATKQAEMVKTIMNSTASSFTLMDLDGHKVSLESLKGKTVVVDFWATWCGPCKASFPAMQKLLDRYKDDKSVAIVFVDTWETADDKKQNATDFIKKSPYTFHVLLDNESKVVADYKVDGIPTKFVIDPNGTTRFKAVGFDGNTDDTVAELDSMIKLAQKQ